MTTVIAQHLLKHLRVMINSKTYVFDYECLKHFSFCVEAYNLYRSFILCVPVIFIQYWLVNTVNNLQDSYSKLKDNADNILYFYYCTVLCDMSPV